MNTTTSRLRARVSALALGLCFTAPAFSQITLISDDFSTVNKSGSGPNQIATSGVNTYTQLSGSVWNFNNVVANSGVLAFPAAGFATAYIKFQPVTLTNTGDYLTLSFKISYPGANATDVNSGLRYSLYNTLGNINTATAYDSVNNTVGDTALGYYLTVNPGSTLANNTGLAKDLGNQAVIGSGGAVNSNANSSATSLGNFTHTSTFGATPQTITLTFTKTAAGVAISGGLGSDTFSANDNTSPYTTFDTFFFASGNSPSVFNMDDLAITTNVSAVPEPATVALIAGLVALAGCAAQRKFRRG